MTTATRGPFDHPLTAATGGADTPLPCPTEPAPAAPARPITTFWFAFWLGVVMAGCKVQSWGLPPEWTSESVAKLLTDLRVLTHEDFLYALALGLLGQGALWLTRARPRARAIVFGAFITLCVASVVYAIASVPIFRALKTPLTYPLIYLAGDARNMQSSLAAYTTPGVIASLIAVPLGYLLLAWVTHRAVQPRRTRWVRVFQISGALLVLCHFAWGEATYYNKWNWHFWRRLSENPHWVLVRSCAVELVGGGHSFRFEGKFPESHLEDFKPAKEKPAGPAWAVQPGQRPRNVIVVVLESTGTQHMGIYGSGYKTTPRLEREAAHGLVLDNFYAHAPMTASSLFGITLSTYPGITWKQYTAEKPSIFGVSAPQVLKPAGYRTAFITAADISWVGQQKFLSNRGFDLIQDYRDLAPQKVFSWGCEDRYMVDGLFRFIDQDKSKPFYAVAWTTQTHHPYQQSPDQPEVNFLGAAKAGSKQLNQYLNCILEADRQIGRILDGLRERGLADDTLVWVTGDHGEAFGWPHPVYFHGGHIYQEAVNVPCILINPRLFPTGRRDPLVAGHVDINPTILDVLGAGAMPGTWQGRSLFDPTRSPRAYFFGAEDDYNVGVREGQWKMIYNGTLGRTELFDLQADPNELKNVADDHPDVAARLLSHLKAWVTYQSQHIERLEGTK